MLKPSRQGIGRAWTAGVSRFNSAVRVPPVPVKSDAVRPYANQLGRLIWRFNVAVNRALVVYREPILDMQLIQERIANCAMEMFASTAVLSRWDSELQAGSRNGSAPTADHRAAELFLRRSLRNIRRNLAELGDNDDKHLLGAANAALGNRAAA